MARKLKTVEGKAEDKPTKNRAKSNKNANSPETQETQEVVVVEADSLVDPLLVEQQAQSTQMRAALLTCRGSDITSAKVALQNIAVLQIYHQVGRIIRFTEKMDLLEDKLYDCIDMSIGGMDSADPATMMMLLKVQGDLYKTMVLSQELLKPYMDIDLAAIAPPRDITDDTSFGAAILPKESRTIIRNGAQALLTELRKTENLSDPTEATESDDGNNTANTQ